MTVAGNPSTPGNRPNVAVCLSSADSSTKPVLVLADDMREYWMKGCWKAVGVESKRVKRSLIAEQVVGRIGKMLGAPVCEVSVGVLPPDRCASGFAEHLEPGLVHLSRVLAPARDSTKVNAEGVNRPRFALFAVLRGWLLGSDLQFLYHGTSDVAKEHVYSADHGTWLGGWDWNSSTLEGASSDVVYPCGTITTDLRLQPDDFRDGTNRLNDLDQANVNQVIDDLPSEWGIADNERLALKRCLHRRRRALLKTLGNSKLNYWVET